jgi:hypothetical protein
MLAGLGSARFGFSILLYHEGVFSMSKNLKRLAVFMILVSLFAVSCSGGTTSTSIGGAQIEAGDDYDEDLNIISPRTSFASGEGFYVSFDNNASFNSDSVTIQADDAETDEIVGEITYEVDPEWTIIVTDLINIEGAGKYKLKAIVDGKVRATQDIVIN